MSHTPRNHGKSKLTTTAMLRILLREMPLLQRELRSDIAALDEKISKSIDGLESDLHQLKSDASALQSDVRVLKSDVSEVKSDLKGLRIQSHQNHICFITNQMDMEKRIKVLETARG